MDLYNTAGSIIPDKPDTSYRVLSNTDDFVETFQEDNPLNWRIDGDKLDEISDDRN